jgi:hypothetical protein
MTRTDSGVRMVKNATVEMNSDRKPQRITIRLPHPLDKKPFHVSGGQYQADKLERIKKESLNY